MTWGERPTLSTSGNLFKNMRDMDAAGRAPQSVSLNLGNFQSSFAAAPTKLEQTYKFHYNAAAALGPECCVAIVDPGGVRIFSNTQSVWGTRQSVYDVLAEALGTKAPPLNRIRVTYYEGGGAFGGASPYEDTAQAAALMSALIGKPVRLQFMRWDSTGWGNYGPPMLADLRGSVDAAGKVSLEFTGNVFQYYVTPPSQQMAAGGKATMPQGVGAINMPMTGEPYSMGSRRVILKTQPLENNYFKMRHLRAPVAPQTAFATEQMIDELAYAAKLDPIEFRRRNIANTTDDPSQRWKNVLENVATLAKWQPRVAASNLSSGERRDGPWLLVRPLREHADRGHRRHRGQQEDRQDRRSSTSTARSTRATSSIRTASTPTRRARRSRASAARSTRRSRSTEGGHERRLGHVSDPALQGRADGHAEGAVEDRRARPVRQRLPHDGRRRAGAGPDGGRDRQRVLRRHGCPHPRGADDAGPRPQLAQGGGQVARPGTARPKRSGHSGRPEWPQRLESGFSRRSSSAKQLRRSPRRVSSSASASTIASREAYARSSGSELCAA